MPVEKWTPERRMERTRAALIASARHLFATRGFEGASLDDIAEAAGYTRGAIYRHFANKEDLFFAVSESVNTEVLDAFAEELDLEEGGPTIDDNRDYAAVWMKALAGNDELWALNVEWSLFQYRNPGVRERSVASLREGRSRVAAFMEHYMSAQGIRFKLPIETVASMLLNAADGFATTARLDPETEHLFATFLDLFLPTVIEES